MALPKNIPSQQVRHSLGSIELDLVSLFFLTYVTEKKITESFWTPWVLFSFSRFYWVLLGFAWLHDNERSL